MNTNRVLIAIIVIALAGSAILGLLLVRDQLGLTPAEAQAPEAIVIVENGLVYYKDSESGEYSQLAQEQSRIASGSFLRTDSDSYARVYFPDNSLVSIDADTEIRIEFEGTQQSIEQLVGKTWHRVQNVASGGSYEVSTPNAIAAVRGTSFSVSFDGNSTTDIEVTESVVEVSGQGSDNQEELIGTQDVTEGMWIQITGLTSDEIELMITETTPERIEAFWFRRNNLFGEEYNRLIGEYSGNEFRDKLQESIDNNPDLLDFSVGFGKIDPDGPKEELEEVFDLLQITEDSCENYTQQQIQNAIIKVDRYASYIANSEELTDILEALFNSCADGNFTVDEAEQLESLIVQFGELES